MSGRAGYRRVSRRSPCPVCERTSHCLLTDDSFRLQVSRGGVMELVPAPGTVLCMKGLGDVPGWHTHGQAGRTGGRHYVPASVYAQIIGGEVSGEAIDAEKAAKRKREREEKERAARMRLRQLAGRVWHMARSARADSDRAALYPHAAGYLAARLGGDVPVVGSIRSIAALEYFEESARGEMVRVGEFPALLAAATDADGKICGIHRIYLRPDGRGKLEGREAKKWLGDLCPGAAVRIGTPEQFGMAERDGKMVDGAGPRELIVCEGVETAYACWMATGVASMALISTAGMMNIRLPARWTDVQLGRIERIVFAADHDRFDVGNEKRPGTRSRAGISAARLGAGRIRQEFGERIAVEIVVPTHEIAPDLVGAAPGTNDEFGDVLLGARDGKEGKTADWLDVYVRYGASAVAKGLKARGSLHENAEDRTGLGSAGDSTAADGESGWGGWDRGGEWGDVGWGASFGTGGEVPAQWDGDGAGDGAGEPVDRRDEGSPDGAAGAGLHVSGRSAGDRGAVAAFGGDHADLRAQESRTRGGSADRGAVAGGDAAGGRSVPAQSDDGSDGVSDRADGCGGPAGDDQVGVRETGKAREKKVAGGEAVAHGNSSGGRSNSSHHVGGRHGISDPLGGSAGSGGDGGDTSGEKRDRGPLKILPRGELAQAREFLRSNAAISPLAGARAGQRWTLCYMHEGDSWYEYSGTNWEKLPESLLVARIQSFFEPYWIIKEKAAKGDRIYIDPSDGTERAVKRAALTSRACAGILAAMKGDCGMFSPGGAMPAWSHATFDGAGFPIAGAGLRRVNPGEQKKVVPVRNGLLRLDALLEGKVVVEPHTPRYISTSCAPFDIPVDLIRQQLERDPLDEEAGGRLCHELCPTFQSVLARAAGDCEIYSREFMKYVAYCFTDDQSFETILYQTGRPGTGKGTLFEGVVAAVGDENVYMSSANQLCGKHEIVNYIGKNIIGFDEFEAGHSTDAVEASRRLKTTGIGTATSVEGKFDDAFTTRITGKFWLISNKLAKLKDSSAAMARRLIIFPTGIDTPTAADRDPSIKRRVRAEARGIMIWALFHLRILYRDGKFVQPPAGLAQLENFKRLVSPVHAFVEDCLVAQRESACEEGLLWKLYAAYAASAGVGRLGKDNLFSELESAVFGLERYREEDHTRMVRGLRPRLEAEDGRPFKLYDQAADIELLARFGFEFTAAAGTEYPAAGGSLPY